MGRGDSRGKGFEVEIRLISWSNRKKVSLEELKRGRGVYLM